jgi:AcrR family transcriptional regulator
MADRRQEILAAALDIADESGLEAVSMRAVAQRIGVTAMALYPHVSSKDDLLDGLVGRLLAELPPPDPAAGWAERLGQIAAAARGLARRHAAAMPLIFSRPAVTEDAVRVVDVIYQALLDAGVPPREVPRMERLVTTFVLGYAVSEAGGRFGTGTLNPRGRRARLPGEDIPAHQELAHWLDEPVDWDAEFAVDVADLAGLIRSVAATAEDPACRPSSGQV